MQSQMAPVQAPTQAHQAQTRHGSSGLVIRALRIVSGLFLLAYVTSHLVNLSFGLSSIAAMDAASPYLSRIWTGPLTRPLLLLALLVHFALGLWAIYKRPTLRTNASDIVQLLTGLFVVPLLATHAIGIHMVQDVGVEFGYAQTVPLFWLYNPTLGLVQVLMLTVVWVHGCAGLFTWLRAKESARNAVLWLYPLALAVPIVALLGYAEAGRTVLIQSQQPVVETSVSQADESTEAAAEVAQTPAPEIPFDLIKQVTNWMIWGSVLLGVITLLARWVRVSMNTTEAVTLRRDDSGPLASSSALSLLDGFRKNHEPHASLCEGRGRCGTCAVRILHSDFPLPEPTSLEMHTLQRINAPENARLACQLVPTGGRVDVAPMYPATYTFHDEDVEDIPDEAAAATQVQVTP